MAYIMVDRGSKQAIWKVPSVPSVGDEIYVDSTTIVWAPQFYAYLKIGSTLRLTKQYGDIDTETEKYGITPHFSTEYV